MRGASTVGTPLIPAFLRVGEIVSLSFRLYRHYLATYARLAKQHKGKASCLFIRLIFCELQGKSETVETLLEQDVSRTKLYELTYWQIWKKLIKQSFVVAIPVLSVGAILLLIVSELLKLWFGYSQDLEPLLEFVYPLGVIVGVFGSFIASCRFYLATPIIFLELDLNNAEAVLNRVASLTRRSARRIFATSLLAMLTIWPLSVPYFSCLTLWLFLMATDQDTILYKVVSWIVVLLLGSLWGRLVTPLHLILKTVLYYDLRSRQEGIDLQLVSR